MGNNYTVNIKSNPVRDHQALTGKVLQSIKFAFDSPFRVQLSDGSVIEVEKVVRLMPKKRMVVFGVWHDQSVVAKLFFDPERAKKHMEKDLAGVKALIANKIPTAALLQESMSLDKSIHVLIFERIEAATNLDMLFREHVNVREIMPQLQAVIIEIATQHVLGILQHDLHLKNFLLTEKTVYTLDGGQIEPFPQLLTKKASMKSLSLFLSQLGVGNEDFQEVLFRYYAKARGWLLKIEDIRDLFTRIKLWNNERWQRFEKKIFRGCSDFAAIQRWDKAGMYDRQYKGPELLHFLYQPESAFKHPSVRVLKAGRSTTVVRVSLDGRDYVIKRYNLKTLWHRVRRCLRVTRAACSWRFAQKLKLFNVATPNPVAFIEKRFLGLRGRSYYVTEYVEGKHVGECLSAVSSIETNHLIKKVAGLLKSLARLDITHGDLKMTNILVNKHQQPTLIDFDGARMHASLSSLRPAWTKDMARFLENFNEQATLVESFKRELRLK